MGLFFEAPDAMGEAERQLAAFAAQVREFDPRHATPGQQHLLTEELTTLRRRLVVAGEGCASEGARLTGDIACFEAHLKAAFVLDGLAGAAGGPAEALALSRLVAALEEAGPALDLGRAMQARTETWLQGLGAQAEVLQAKLADPRPGPRLESGVARGALMRVLSGVNAALDAALSVPGEVPVALELRLAGLRDLPPVARALEVAAEEAAGAVQLRIHRAALAQLSENVE